MAGWTFSLSAVDPDKRTEAWNDVLARLGLPVANIGTARVDTGSVTVASAPIGTEFALMRASPQTFSGRISTPRATAWVGALLDGRGTLAAAHATVPVERGAIIVGASGVDATLRLDERFSLLFVHFPAIAVSPRLVTQIERTVRVVSGAEGFERIFFEYLAAVAEQIDALADDHLHAIEQASVELLAALLATLGGVAGKGGAAGSRANHLRRLCQWIETQLPNPALSLGSVAAENGVSPRYLQMLFKSAGLNFAAYVRERRLDRCFTDLASPIHAQLSVAEIGYRWGFGDPPHFSRVFRAHFGVPPSVHRQRAREAGPGQC